MPPSSDRQHITDMLDYWIQDPKFSLNFILGAKLVSPFKVTFN